MQTGKLSFIESAVVLLFSLMLLALGLFAIGPSYLVYNQQETVGNFLWLEAVVLMIGLGVGGVIVFLANLCALRKGNEGN